MDDFDSFSTVVTKAAPQPKDDFDSFSSVVDAAPKPKPTATKKGILDRAKDAISEGVSNIAKEHADGRMVDNAFQGLVHGVTSTVGGASQLLARGMDSAANYVAPGSALADWTKKSVALTDADVQKHEDAYQKATKGSVAAGFGRVGGSVALPLGGSTAAARGAPLMTKAADAAVTGAKVGAVQPVYTDPETGKMTYAKDKTIQVAGGAALGAAAPLAGKALLELASKAGSTTAEQALINTRKAQLFDKSPNAKADAEVISDLGGVNARTVDRKMLTGDINARSKKLVDDSLVALKNAGASDAEMLAMKNWQGLTEAERQGLANTPQGKAVSDIVAKLDRIRGLTPGELSSKAGAMLRTVTDLLPIPSVLRYPIRQGLGGRTTRAESAANLLDSRSQSAASQYLAENGASDGTKAIQSLQGIAQAKAKAQAALDAAKAAQDAKDAGVLAAKELKARQISRTPGGGAYQALKEHTGLNKADLNTVLRVGQKIPEFADDVRAIRVGGDNTQKDAIYPLTDTLNAIADGLGMQRVGALTQAPPPGVLSGLAPVSAKYQMGTAVRQKIYDKAEAEAGKIGNVSARESARELAQKFKSTPKSTEARNSMIDALEKQYPETSGLFDAVRRFN